MTTGAQAPPAAARTQDTIGWIVRRAGLAEVWESVARRTPEPAALVATLVAAGFVQEALRAIAVALPARQAIWWSWVMARQAIAREAAAGAAPSPRLVQLQQFIDAWIAAPDDARRRTVWSLAERLGLDHAMTLTGAAVWFSGGNIATEPGAPAVGAPPGIAAGFVAAAVHVAAVAGDPARMGERVHATVAQGLEVVTRLGGWAQSVSWAQREFMGGVDAAPSEGG